MSFPWRTVSAVVAVVLCCGLAGCATARQGRDTASATATAVSTGSLASEVPASIRSAGYLTFASSATIKPLYYLDPSGQIIGAEAEQARAVAKKLGLQIHLENIAFAGVVPALQSGRIDFTAVTDSAAREASLDFIDYNHIYFSFVVPKGNPRGISGAGSLCGQTLAMPQGVPQIPSAQAWSTDCTSSGKAAIKINLFTDEQSSLLAVKSGQADALIVDNMTGPQLVKSTGGLSSVGKVLSSYAGFGVSKQNPELRRAIQDATAAVMKDGTMKSIAAKYGVSSLLINTALLNAGTAVPAGN